MFKGKVDTSSSGGGDETSYRPSTMTPAACKQTANQGAQARTEKSSPVRLPWPKTNCLRLLITRKLFARKKCEIRKVDLNITVIYVGLIMAFF